MCVCWVLMLTDGLLEGTGWYIKPRASPTVIRFTFQKEYSGCRVNVEVRTETDKLGD